MMPSSASSTPISIPASSPIAINRRDSSSDDDDDGDSIEERRHNRTALDESDSLAELRVGSLPMHLRRPGRGSNSNNGLRQYHRNNSSEQLQQFRGPMSLPPPRAPFLSARQDMENKLSRYVCNIYYMCLLFVHMIMQWNYLKSNSSFLIFICSSLISRQQYYSMPEMALPESVASTDPELSSSAPFGSLRESKFTHPHLDRWQQSSNGSSIQQTTTTQFQPQSLPAYAATGSGGIGSFFPESNDFNTSERNTFNESSGIGGLLDGTREGDNNNDYLRDVAGITNEYSQLTLDGFGRLYEDNSQGNVSFDNGRPNHTINGGNLSSSLTALDMLARMRQTTQLAPPLHLERLEPNEHPPSSSRITGLMENSSTLHHQQQQQHHEAQSPVGGNEQQYDHQADLFEAFDFELDE